MTQQRIPVYDLVAPGVSLFLIISGVLLLSRDEPVGVFFKKRFLRILPPFLFWSLVTFTLGRLMEGNRDFPHFLPDYFRDLATGGSHGIYWFVYMIIGLYLVTPVLRVVCREERALLYLSLFLLISAFIKLCGDAIPVAILPFVLTAAVLPLDTALLWLADKLRLGRLVA